jgi:hypothetical protein
MEYSPDDADSTSQKRQRLNSGTEESLVDRLIPIPRWKLSCPNLGGKPNSRSDGWTEPFRTCGNKLARLLLVCLKLWRSRYVPSVFDASKSWCVFAKRIFSMKVWELLMVFLEDIVVSLTCEKNILSVCTPFLWMSGLTEIFNVVAMFYSVCLASIFSLISFLSEVV